MFPLFTGRNWYFLCRFIIQIFRTFQNTMHTCSIKQYRVASVMSIALYVLQFDEIEGHFKTEILDVSHLSKWTYRSWTPKYMHVLKIQIKKKGMDWGTWIEYIWPVSWKYCIVCLPLNTKRSKHSSIIHTFGFPTYIIYKIIFTWKGRLL